MKVPLSTKFSAVFAPLMNCLGKTWLSQPECELRDSDFLCDVATTEGNW